MTITTITQPAIEPVSLAEFKSHSRVDFADEDADASTYIAAAREIVEAFTNRRLISQTVRMTRNGFTGTIHIPVGPVQSITQITYTDTAGDSQVVDAADYRLINSHNPPFIAPVYQGVWPTPLLDWDAVLIDLVVGYGDNPGDVPEVFRQAIRLMANDLYEHRGDVVVGTISAVLPRGAVTILAPHILHV